MIDTVLSDLTSKVGGTDGESALPTANLKALSGKGVATGASALPKANLDAFKGQIETINKQLSKQIEGLKDKGGDVSMITSLLGVTQNLMGQLKAVPVEPPPELELPSDGDTMLFDNYFARLEASRTALSDPTALARLAHDVHVELVYLRILNGEMPGSAQTDTLSAKGCPLVSIALTTDADPVRFREKNARGDEVLNEAGRRLLATYLYTDAKRQQEVHLLTLQTDQLMKLLYLQQETELLDSMLEQQDALVRGLSDWSDYLDQQTHEYVEMYEKMDALLSTQRRQSSFTVRDIQSLEQWTYWSQVVFWILLASCGVIAVVHNYSAVSKTAEAIDAGIGRVRTAVGA